jgi:dTDP-4-amino-4,6-dideoxygalactose transaminase
VKRFIPQAAPQLRIARYHEAVAAAIGKVLASDAYILGGAVAGFEAAFAAYLGIGHCVGVNSGTDALMLACRALDLPPGGEVLTVAMTSPATATAIVLAGCTPRFVDVSPETRCIDPDHVAAAIGPRTVAIVPVHLHGHPADMVRLMAIADAHGLALIEDCAQAHGARIGERMIGTFGHVAAFSFYPTKNLGGAGDAGAVVTADGRLAERLRALRTYGWQGSARSSEVIGYNSRLQELQAAILGVLLPHLESGNFERGAIARRYRAALRAAEAAGTVRLPPGTEGHVYHQFAIEAGDRDGMRERLLGRGVGTGLHYAVPLHRQPAFAPFVPAGTHLPVSDAFAARLLSLPIQPEVVGDAVEDIAAEIVAALPQQPAALG